MSLFTQIRDLAEAGYAAETEDEVLHLAGLIRDLAWEIKSEIFARRMAESHKDRAPARRPTIIVALDDLA